jgi:hypothetical protein
MTNLYNNVDENTLVGTYLQSYKYFEYQNIPFQLLKSTWAQEWSKSQSINTCIHIRRGDYLDYDIYRNMMPGIEYYRAAMILVSAIEPNATYFVASDDLNYVQNIDLFRNMRTSAGLQPDEILAVMSTCLHTIMSVGSFGWWGVYLSSSQQGLKIYYNEKHDNTFWTTNQIIESDHYPPHWIGLNLTMIQNILKVQ